jgi:dTDP-4-dehydrorhamnose 3,5-epimerase-like enzyme
MNSVKRRALEVHGDERGWVVNPLVSPFPERPVGQVHVASLEPGAVRGNHYHPGSSEYVFVWGGSAEVVWEEGDGTFSKEAFEGGHPVVLEIPPGVPHAVVNTGGETVYLIAYYLGESDSEWPDTEARKLV